MQKELEEIYYGSKTSTAFTSLTRAFNNTTKIETEITSGTTVNQTYSAVNENNTTFLGSMSNKALGTQFHNQVIPQFVQLRKKRKISQLEMDEILGVAKGLVSKWECGIRKPSGWLFCCWAEALGAEIMLKEKKNGS